MNRKGRGKRVVEALYYSVNSGVRLDGLHMTPVRVSGPQLKI